MKKPSVISLLVTRYLTEWLSKYLPLVKNVSPHSLRSYKVSITMFMTYLSEVKHITPASMGVECFSNENITDWVIWMSATRGCVPSTCNIRLSALRSFLGYMSGKDIQFLNSYLDSCNIQGLKTVRKKVVGLSKEGVKALLESHNLKDKKGLRDFTMTLLLYSCALRVSELLNLKIKDIKLDVAKPYITVIGKGKKLRAIPLLSKPATYLKRYIAVHHDNNDENGYLFYTNHRNDRIQMTTRNYDKILKKHAMEANKMCVDVPLTLHPHQLRHAKASHWLENGMNIAQISHLLGHESLQTTMVYLDITIEEENRALTTIETEDEKAKIKKWKSSSNDKLLEFLGLKNG